MHIAYITHEYPPDTGKGGIGTYTLQMAKVMYNLGHHVEVFTASFNRNTTEKYNDILTHRIRIEQIVDFRNKVVDVFTLQHKIKKFDLIESPEIGGEAEILIQQFPEIPLVVRLHTPAVLVTRLQNTYLPLTKKIQFVLGAFLRGKIDLGFWSRHDKNKCNDPDFLITKKAAIITAPSDAMKRWAVDFWELKPERIEVIPNPYEPPKELLQLNSKAEYKQITFIGRLNVLKGIVGLSNALHLVFSKYPDWKICFIGPDEASHIAEMSMKEWIQKKLNKFARNIEFIDWIDNNKLSKYFAETDIVVIPSLFESFSYVCAEAMSAAKAIVGSKIGGMQELLGENEYGLTINPYKPRQISNAIIKLIKNPMLRQQLGAKARQKIINEYNEVAIGNQIEGLFEKLIK
ncbi:MAG: glycosyltransferase family 4 protein [Bacteroidales bacterium]|nr:glycosyltransferase family 4 protein [Bacteroidales bacterium]